MLASFSAMAQEPEFHWFSLTDISGSLSALHTTDQTLTSGRTADTTTAADRQADKRSAVALTLATQSHVYHPNLLKLQADFGLTWQRAAASANPLGPVQTTRSSDALYDMAVRATVLRDKPYTGIVFYERLNPSVTVGPALVIQQRNTRQGFQFSLLSPVTTVPTTLDASRQRTLGTGGGRVFDDRTDRLSLSADRAIGRLGTTRLRVDDSRLDSQSGSTDLPIVRTKSHMLTAGLDTRLQWGAEGKYRLSHVLTYNTLAYGLGSDLPADRRDWRSNLDLRTYHAKDLQSFVAVNTSDSRQGGIPYRSRDFATGLAWWPTKDLAISAEARGDTTSLPELTSSNRGLSGSGTYQWTVVSGRAQAAYATRFEARSQRAGASASTVTGERHALTGVSLIPLDRPRAEVNSIRVQNESRTQTFVLGSDYLVSTLGTQVRLQRLVGGDIIDGQAVLVDYMFQSGGTFDSTQWDQTLNLAWSWSNRFRVFARWLDIQARVTGGVSAFELNSIRSATYGMQAEVPLFSVGSVGGSLEREDRRETILPLRRTSSEAWIQWEDGLLGQGGLRVAVRRQRVEYDNSAQDIDLSAHDVRYHLLTSSGIDLQAEWSSETDAGAMSKRHRDLGSLRARWRYRQLMMSLSMTRVSESQGELRTRRTYGQWTARRDF